MPDAGQGRPPPGRHAKSRIPTFSTIEEEAEFWDTHDITEFEDELELVTDVKFVKGSSRHREAPTSPGKVAGVETTPELRGSKLAEKIAYWFFRLNGCATIENFVVHPNRRGSQRTDVDILAVRFPHRCELPDSGPLEDHGAFTRIDRVQIILAEVKSGPCSLNRPWTNRDNKNMQEILHAVGAFPRAQVDAVARHLYDNREFSDDGLLVRLFVIGARESEEDNVRPPVVQIIWDDVLGFVHSRMNDYGKQKKQKDQWDKVGQRLYSTATEKVGQDLAGFVQYWKREMGINPDPS